MKIRHLLLIMGSGLVAGVPVRAQFTLQGEFRPRFEYRNGYQKLPDSSTSFAAFVSNRLRLSALYRNDLLNAKVTFQEVRVWGSEKTKSDAATLGVYEAWAELKVFDSLRLRLGRQELIYDNERIMSNNNWRQTGQTHDAAVLKWTRMGWKLDFGAAFNQTEENLFGTSYDNSQSQISGNYKTLNYLWITKNMGHIRFHAAAIADGFQKLNTKNTTYLRLTYGGGVTYVNAAVTGTVRAYLQSGKTQAGQDIAAFYLNPELTVKVTRKFSVNPGMELISGNDFTDQGNKKYNEFVTLYGTGHQFNGHMDYFTNFAKDTKGAGLKDLYLKLSLKVSEKTTLKADYHYFALDNKYVSGGETLDKNLGNEADLNCKVDFSKEISLSGGYSFMFGDKTLEKISGGDEGKTGQWAWLMLTVKPTLFAGGK